MEENKQALKIKVKKNSDAMIVPAVLLAILLLVSITATILISNQKQKQIDDLNKQIQTLLSLKSSTTSANNSTTSTTSQLTYKTYKDSYVEFQYPEGWTASVNSGKFQDPQDKVLDSDKRQLALPEKGTAEGVFGISLTNNENIITLDQMPSMGFDSKITYNSKENTLELEEMPDGTGFVSKKKITLSKKPEMKAINVNGYKNSFTLIKFSLNDLITVDSNSFLMYKSKIKGSSVLYLFEDEILGVSADEFTIPPLGLGVNFLSIENPIKVKYKDSTGKDTDIPYSGTMIQTFYDDTSDVTLEEYSMVLQKILEAKRLK